MDIPSLDPTRTNQASTPSAALSGAALQGSEKPKGGSTSTDSVQLSEEAQAKVAELKARDEAVRAHEAAHLSAAGGLAKGGASFTYAQGPDGKSYAVGGEVSIDTSAVPNDPAATMTKAQQIQAAAMAPADPSPQDRQVAAAAARMAAQAASQLAQTSQDRSSSTTQSSASGYPSTAKPLGQAGLDIVA